MHDASHSFSESFTTVPRSQSTWHLADDPSSGRSCQRLLLLCCHKRPSHTHTAKMMYLRYLNTGQLFSIPMLCVKSWNMQQGAVFAPYKQFSIRIRQLLSGCKISQCVAPGRCSYFCQILCAITPSSQSQAARPSTWRGCTCDT